MMPYASYALRLLRASLAAFYVGHVKLYPETLKSSYDGLYALAGLLKRSRDSPEVNKRICIDANGTVELSEAIQAALTNFTLNYICKR